MTYDLRLPADAPEMQFLRESAKYRVYYYTDSHGDTVYQGEFKSSFTGSWFDDSDAIFYDDDKAIDWWEDNVNGDRENYEH